ncbi:uncharacterized protein LOC120204496 [Hibiscus syriacus]|uniref:uncharacterized protein LOC120204496 n=1 Tax=Hibiscus syriacus TaxID=106335 RepID=UPI001921AF39|nr:uncharacterized protein LOC120204496 [Hibiscus syriacus]
MKSSTSITKATSSNLGTKMATTKLKATRPEWKNNTPSRSKNTNIRNKTLMTRTTKLNNSKPTTKMKPTMMMKTMKMILKGANLLLLKRNPSTVFPLFICQSFMFFLLVIS